MGNLIFKILTALLFIVTWESQGAQISQTLMAQNLRWTFDVPKDYITFDKGAGEVSIRTLNRDIYRDFKKSLARIPVNKNYIKSIRFQDGNKVADASTIKIQLKGKEIEVFNFYKRKSNQYVLDFWENPELVKKPVKKTPRVQKIPKVERKIASVESEKDFKILKKVTKKELPAIPKKFKKIKKRNDFRDFRYGAAYYWDYPILGPTLKEPINIRRKTPEFLYPIKDRDYAKGKKESHLQLTINLYRNKKYGLMYKSIKLFVQKYGDTDNFEINEYLKINALLRDNFYKGKSMPVKAAINMMINLSKRAKDYDLVKTLKKYILSYYLIKGDYLNLLREGKSLFLLASNKYDKEEKTLAAKSILFGLSRIGQIDKIDELLKEKEFLSVISRQQIYAYKIFTQMKMGKLDDLLKFYDSIKRELVGPIFPSILYNVGEASFRVAKFEQALKLFDQYVTHHSHHSNAGRARVRMGLIYEILEKDPYKTIKLYENAINRGFGFDIVYEAKIRYVSMANIRKLKPTTEDKELKFLLKHNLPDVKALDENLKILLWMVRLRSLIVEEDYSSALLYLNSVPLRRLRPTLKRVFSGDGAEIIHGLILKNFEESKYSKIIQIWESYKNVYVNKVASDPLINFIVGKSYIKLKLYDGFGKVLENFRKIQGDPKRTFPLWVKRKKARNPRLLIEELSILRNMSLKNWDLAKKQIAKIEKTFKDPIHSYYKGIIAYREKDYDEAITNLEQFISGQESPFDGEENELANLLQAYTDSIYNTNKLEKFKTVAKALLNDTKEVKEAENLLGKVKERLNYFYIEILVGEKKDESNLLGEVEIKRFKENFPKSKYLGRIEFLLGLLHLEADRIDEAKKLFEELINKEGIPNYIKEQARSELSLIRIREKTI